MKIIKVFSIFIFTFFVFVACGSENNEENDNNLNDDKIQQCEDSEGRKYNEGDFISHECRRAYCMSGGWAENGSECYPCGSAEIGAKMEWVCTDGEKKVDWCECVENEEHGSRWDCVKRADLNCPSG